MGAVLVWLAGGWAAGAGVHMVVLRYCEASRGEVQALSAAGCGLAALCTSGPALGGAVALVLWCVCLSVVDIHTLRLPNPLTGVGAVAVAVVSVGAGRWQAAALGAGLLTGAYLAGKSGFGGGDAKLAVGLGGITAMAGGQVWLVSAVGALVLTAAAGLWRGRRTWAGGGPVPHGPSMCLASLLTLAALG